jgi:hypothetical protein
MFCAMKTIITPRFRSTFNFAMGMAVLAAIPLWADLSRDASTARIMGDEGEWVMENAVQLEKDKDGKTWAFETGLQYTPRTFPRLSLLLEPVLWELSEPKDGPTVSGVGDTDFTLNFLAIPEKGPWPAVVVGGKVKIPTANDREIGTGKADYGISLIAGKEYGELDIGLELEYETFGDPPAERAAPDPTGEPLDPDEIAEGGTLPAAATYELNDMFSYSLSADYGLTENLSVFAEFFGNTAPSNDEDASNGAKIGLEFDVELTEYATPFVAVEIDTDDVFAAKVGVEWIW